MEYLSIWNAFGQSYLNHIKEMERESAINAATLTAKFCCNTHPTHQNLSQQQQQHFNNQTQQHNNSNCNNNQNINNNNNNNSNNTKNQIRHHQKPIVTTMATKTTSSMSTASSSSSSSISSLSTSTSSTATPMTSTTTAAALVLPTSLPSPPASRTSSTASSPGSATIATTTTAAAATSAAAAAAVLHLQQLQQHQQHLQQQQIQIEQEQHQRRQQQHHELLHHHARQQRHHLQHNQQQQQQQQQNDSQVANSLLWQPWRDLQHAAAVHHRLYQQQLRKEARLNAKELPTAKWRRDRRMRAAEYHTTSTSGISPVGISTITATSAVASSSSSSSPPLVPAAAPVSPDPLEYVLHPVMPHDISVVPPAPSTSPQAPMSMMVAAAAAAAANMRPLCESNSRSISLGGAGTSPGMLIGGGSTAAFIPQHAHQHAHQQLFAAAAQQQSMESPLDMSVSSSNSMKQRSSPPPPYREPLPGSSYATSLARPSVITQAPSKRGMESIPSSGVGNHLLISNRENENRSTESVSMCENVIDEHFRRSLGADYAALFGKRASPAPSSHATSTPSPQPQQLPPQLANTPPPVSPQAVSAVAAHNGAQLVVKHNQPSHALPPLGMQPPPPAYHQALPTRPLISPKPAAELLSPTAAAAYIKEVQPPNAHSPSPLPLPLLAPQQQPLSLHRSASNSPCSPLSPQPLVVSGTNSGNVSDSNTQKYNHVQRLTAKRRASPPPPIRTAVELPIRHSPTPPPSHTPPVAAVTNTPTATAPIVLPAIMRIKTEPGLPTAMTMTTTTTTTPPASPNSSSNASNSDVMASVDDHFAKALGDTWKKLQERK